MSSVPCTPVHLDVGMTMPVHTSHPLSRNDFVRYAGASGDFNPIHHDETVARSSGYASVFGMGLLHAGMLGLRLARWVGPDSVREFKVRYTAQVWPGDTLTFTGEVVAVTGGIAELELGVARQTGELAGRATARVVVASP